MKKTLIIIASLSFALGTTSCKLFKKTKKCDTCPSWKAAIKTTELKIEKA